MILIDLFENTNQNSELFDQFKHIFAVGFKWPELESMRKSLQDTYDKTANVN